MCSLLLSMNFEKFEQSHYLSSNLKNLLNGPYQEQLAANFKSIPLLLQSTSIAPKCLQKSVSQAV